MAACVSCGREANGAAFCPHCGAAQSGGTAATAAASLPTNIVGVLCYFFMVIGGVAFLLIPPYNQNKEVRFHAFQSIFLTIAWVVASIALGIVASFGPLYMLYPLVNLAALVLWVYLLLRTYQGQRVVLPIIGPLAEQQA